MAKEEDEKDDRKRKYNSMISTEVREGSRSRKRKPYGISATLEGIRFNALTRLLAWMGGSFRARVPVRFEVSGLQQGFLIAGICVKYPRFTLRFHDDGME